MPIPNLAWCLVLFLGLACLPARINETPRRWRLNLAAGPAVNSILGVGLQFYPDNFFSPSLEIVPRGTDQLVRGSSGANPWANSQPLDYAFTCRWGTWANPWAKIHQGYTFVGDWPTLRRPSIVLLACLFALALLLFQREHAADQPPQGQEGRG